MFTNMVRNNLLQQQKDKQNDLCLGFIERMKITDFIKLVDECLISRGLLRTIEKLHGNIKSSSLYNNLAIPEKLRGKPSLSMYSLLLQNI